MRSARETGHTRGAGAVLAAALAVALAGSWPTASAQEAGGETQTAPAPAPAPEPATPPEAAPATPPGAQPEASPEPTLEHGRGSGAHAELVVACTSLDRVAAEKLPAADPRLAQLRRFATGAGVRVAVIDTGVAAHPQLRHLTAGPDFVDPAFPDPLLDCDSHGTIVAGVIAGERYGVAPDAQLVSIRQTSSHYRDPAGVLEGGTGSLQTLADALNAAVDADARVINVSVVSCLPAEDAARVDMRPIDAALARAERSGAVVVAAAGNLSESCEPGYVVVPAHAPTVLAVAARGDAHSLAPYSLPGPDRPLSAPGAVEVALASDGVGWARGTVAQRGQTQPYAGTSFAAPVVSGAAALLFQRYPALSPAQVRGLIYAAAQPGEGAIDPLLVIQQLPPADLTPRPPAVIEPPPARRPAAASRWHVVAGAALAAVGLTVVSRAFAFRRRPHASPSPQSDQAR